LLNTRFTVPPKSDEPACDRKAVTAPKSMASMKYDMNMKKSLEAVLFFIVNQSLSGSQYYSASFPSLLHEDAA